MNDQTLPPRGLATPNLPNKSSFIPLKACRNLEEAFQSREFLERIEASVPQHVTPSRMLRTFVSAVGRTPLLAQASVRSFVGACLTAAQVGLEPNTPLGHLWLIPFKSKKWNPATRQRDIETVEINVIFGYPGLLDLSFRSSLVRSVHADVVWPGDEFSYEYGTDAHVRHRPKGMPRSDTAQPDYAYMHAVLKDGQAFEVMPYSEVLRIRNRSQAFRAALEAKENAESKGWRIPATWTEAPWVAHETAMARKTAFRAGSKWLPRSVELASAIALDEAADRRRKIDFGRALDAPTIDGTPDYLGAAVDAATGPDEPDGPPDDNRGAAFGLRGGTTQEPTGTDIPKTPASPPAADPPKAPRTRRATAAPQQKAPVEDADRATVAMKNESGAVIGDVPIFFEALLLDERGDPVREASYFDPLDFATATVEYVKHLSTEDAEACLAHNADAIAEARELSEKAGAMLDAMLADLQAEDEGPRTYETIVPQADRGRLHWIGYVRTFKERLAKVTPGDLLGWLEAQHEHLVEAPNAQFLLALRALNDAAGKAGVSLPSWLAEKVKPQLAKPPEASAESEDDPDKRWADRQLSELARVKEIQDTPAALKAFYDIARAQAVQHVMARLRRDKPLLFERCDTAFTATLAQLQARPTGADEPPPDDPDDPGPEAA